ncbi:urease accessory protein UreE [uncultured Psychrobacter sp.]|uniref:urease accessory protein UreE n=1 Tax=uncultured Psychrobacter sp. TaxID=259303 RepID=UPI0034590D12
MLELTTRVDDDHKVDESEIQDTLTLPYELRIRGRLKATTDNGREVGLFLDRGPVMRHGDLLKASSGEIIQVCAADEPVTTAYIENGLPLGRLCYHLGNRHVTLALGSDADGRYWVRFPPDYVLEELAELLGATLIHHEAPFDPESGAYAQAGREHSHDHNHEHHSHGHSHDSHSHSHNNLTEGHSDNDGHHHAH